MKENVDVTKHLLYINKLLLGGKFKKLISEAPGLVKKYDDQPFFRNALAVAYSQMGEPEKGLEVLLEAEKKFKNSYEIEFQIAKIYELLEDYDNAIDYFYKSLKSTPEKYRDARADCLNDLAVLFSNMGNKDKAKELWKKAIEIDPAHDLAKENLLIEEGDVEKFETTEFIQGEFEEFVFIQKCKCLDEQGKQDFSSTKEEINFLKHMEAAWINRIMPEVDSLTKMSEDERTDMYADMDIDLTQPIPEITLPPSNDGKENKINEIFSFLPANGFLKILAATPALEYAGMKSEKITQMISGESEITESDKEILKWAYEIGNIVLEFPAQTNKKLQKKLFDQLIKTIELRLDKDDGVIVIDKLFRQGKDW
ncbi:MAG: tetratricopeptide repeat protein [bacterium]